MRVLSLSTPLENIRGITPRFLTHLARLKINTIQDLLFHFPNRYEDYSQIFKIADLAPGQQATLQGVVQEVNSRRSFRRHMAIVEATIQDESGSIRAVWFNQPFMRNALRVGRLANFSGKVISSDNDVYLSNPTYEIVGASETKHTGRLVPIYPETHGLTSKGLRFLIQPLLTNLAPIADWLPEDVRIKSNLLEVNTALQSIHFPHKMQDAERAEERFAFEDLFLLQLLNIRQKLKLAKEEAPILSASTEWVKQILDILPFELTNSQKKSLWEIMQDLNRKTPMNRLLQGDVGSGKTIIAALAAIITAHNGYQSAFMAPTEILAEQHFSTLKKLFETIESKTNLTLPNLALLTANQSLAHFGKELTSDLSKKNLTEKIRQGEIKIVVGTHALIAGKQKLSGITFAKLGLVIVDEQHRFGVEQRAKLLTHKDVVPHFLSMSATPIPRTVMLTVFGDLDISIINELPRGRKKIITKIVDPAKRKEAYAFIRDQVHHGHQAFVICPRIEPENENIDIPSIYKNIKKLELKSAKEEYEKLTKHVFPDLKVGMLHGQMKAVEKEKIMSDFKKRKIDILVSTSVVEVGVDIPNATVMMIEGSERFGLAQLYQFRGRVGRGEHQSFCMLFTDSTAATTNARLKAILEAKNGFELAEKDLELRGPGQFLGTEQTGLPDIAMQGLKNPLLIQRSRAAAQNILDKDSTLANYPVLKEKLESFKTKIHLE